MDHTVGSVLNGRMPTGRTPPPIIPSTDPGIPRDRAFDSTFSLLAGGYDFISSRCASTGCSAFASRLLLRRVVFAKGADAARMFYAPGRFTRRGATPPTALLLLQDRGSVSILDGPAHRHRKGMFLHLLDDPNVHAMAACLEEIMEKALLRWSSAGTFCFHDEIVTLLCEAACSWMGIGLEARRLDALTAELSAMISGAGAVGPRNWRAMMLRARTERWAREKIREARNAAEPTNAPLAVIALHRDADGSLLPEEVAAVELINILRPVVAVGRYITFGLLALHEHRTATREINWEDERSVARFLHEVRRFYPFFPFTGGRVLEPFQWRGHEFRRGAWVILDLYGTNHDPALWDSPSRFDPTRFLREKIDPFNLIPQGGGSHDRGHRCPGEGLTLALMRSAIGFMVRRVRYRLPAQDLTISRHRFPTLPQSRLRMTDVRPEERSSEQA